MRCRARLVFFRPDDEGAGELVDLAGFGDNGSEDDDDGGDAGDESDGAGSAGAGTDGEEEMDEQAREAGAAKYRRSLREARLLHPAPASAFLSSFFRR